MIENGAQEDGFPIAGLKQKKIVYISFQITDLADKCVPSRGQSPADPVIISLNPCAMCYTHTIILGSCVYWKHTLFILNNNRYKCL